eukprot:jgi/Bigna1/131325/aug1.14_g6033
MAAKDTDSNVHDLEIYLNAHKDLPKAEVLKAIETKYSKRQIYSRIATSLISVNPYLPVEAYDENTYEKFDPWVYEDIPPRSHVFGTARDAYRNCVGFQRQRHNCAIVAHGISGSGKTENIRLVLRYILRASSNVRKKKMSLANTNGIPLIYLASITSKFNFHMGDTRGIVHFDKVTTLYEYKPQRPADLHIKKGEMVQVLKKNPNGWWYGKNLRTNRLGLFPSNYVEVIAAPPRSRGKEEPPATLEEKVMHAFCLLETFGNAKLMGNDNSTRDGCVFTLAVDRRGRLRHGAVTNFMVEQMRVTHQESHCYGFHVVYRVLAKVNAQGTNEEKKLFLSQPLNFLRKSTTDMREAALLFLSPRSISLYCMIGFSSDDMKAIEDVLKGILALGNIDFVNFVNAGTEISKESRPYLEFASRSLGIKEQILEALLTGTLSPAYGDNPGRMLCKSIASEAFSLVFEYVLQTINESLGAGGSNGDISSVRYAVLVDLPGFEYLGEKNTIEQVSINFASEALQSVYEEQVRPSSPDEKDGGGGGGGGGGDDDRKLG